MKKYVVYSLLCILFLLVYCGPQYVAPKTPNGDPIVINIKIDPNLVDSLTVDHQNARKGLANWMANNLNDKFRKAKYKSQVIPMGQDMPDNGYQISVKFIKAHFQNKAARFFVGIAAGAALLEIKYQVSDGKDIIIDEAPPMIDSVKGERECAHYFNKKIFQEVHEKMQKKYGVAAIES
ncbi:MAG: DUF4410 domain-containing protein [Calditrichaceae bacterium]